MNTENRFVCDLEDLSVLHLDAGNDLNGNPRRVYVLAHPTAGFLAAVDEGYEGWAAIGDFAAVVVLACPEAPSAEAAILLFSTRLRDRILPTLDTSPSQRTRLLCKAVQANFASRRTIVRIGGAQ